MGRRSVPDRMAIWLQKIQKMTEVERDTIRKQVSEGVVLTANNLAKRAAIMVYDQQVKERLRLAQITKKS